MTAMQYYFRCASLFVLGLVFTGCCCTPKGGACSSNIKNGIPIIICQPESRDAFVSDAVSFSVEVDQSNCRYEWFRESVGQNGLVTQTSQKGKQGALTSMLTLSNLQEADSGFYFCSIQSEAGVATRTRDAELTVYPKPYSKSVSEKEDARKAVAQKAQFAVTGTQTNLHIVTQLSEKQLPPNGAAGPSTCPGNYFVTTSQRFNVDTSLARLHAPGTAPASDNVTLHLEKLVNGTWVAVPPTDWLVRWQPTTTTVSTCGPPPGTTDPNFSVPAGADYIFTACFLTSEPGSESLRMTVTWTY
jgi:hypothetical protein